MAFDFFLQHFVGSLALLLDLAVLRTLGLSLLDHSFQALDLLAHRALELLEALLEVLYALSPDLA